MPSLKIDFWDYQDTRGQLQIIRGCPTRKCEELHYLFGRLTEELTGIKKPFEAAYQESAFLRSLCQRMLELCGVDHRYVSPLMINQLLVNPAHQYLINFVSSDEQVNQEIEKLTLAESNAQLEAALVASGLVPSLEQAKTMTASYSFDSLRAIVEAHADMINPDSENNKRKAAERRRAELEEDRAQLEQYMNTHSLA